MPCRSFVGVLLSLTVAGCESLPEQDRPERSPPGREQRSHRSSPAAHAGMPLAAVSLQAGRLNLACYDRAREETVLTRFERRRLCRGARSSEPVGCFQTGKDQTTLTDREAILLCRCASSSEPVECYEEAEEEFLLPSNQILASCRVTFSEIFCPQ
jgi:hypothetical protein